MMTPLIFLKHLANYRFREAPRLLVVGAPRSGFTLLISILTRLLERRRFRPNPFQDALHEYIPRASDQIYTALEDYFRKHIDPDRVVVSPEFRHLVGGPKWLRSDRQDMASVRKYIGVKQWGDFLAILSIPKVAMDYDRVIHSHSHPDRWLQEEYYAPHMKFASIRNPLDMLNSATFSLNALTGDYIDYHIHADSEDVRSMLGLYKLTDLNFIDGLINPLKEYLDAFLPVMDQYHIMRWEDLITRPAATIGNISERAGLSISEKQAEHMWDDMKFKNQTAAHRHNFRKGIIGDWKNHLLNEHLEIIKSRGMEPYIQALDYGPIEYLNPGDYTPFQKRVADYVKKGKIWDEIEDRDLFMFAFNKSNFRSDKYDFVSYTGNGLVDIERSSIKDEALLRGFMDAVERCLEPINAEITQLYNRYAT